MKTGYNVEEMSILQYVRVSTKMGVGHREIAQGKLKLAWEQTVKNDFATRDVGGWGLFGLGPQ